MINYKIRFTLFFWKFKIILESLYIMLYNLRKKGERTLIFYPDAYFKNAKQITTEFLNKNIIKALILDLDNTLIDYNKNVLFGVKEWVDNMNNEGIKLCILSNTNNKRKVENVSRYLEIPFIYFAMKPLKFGFKKGMNKLKLPNKNIAVIGDQLLTDVLGANRAGMYSILVKPINEKDILITKIKRPLEKKIMDKYLNKKS